ncbi:ABC transporter ATP-binding protein [Marinobacterium nitratireducens]|uniref:ABC transporter ATP-binding protein n=1 Tax=Marinobacterium nitratireducens TaxID=518897 RepID=A0A917ZM47_9GAMM|nr:ATP-binding cassette domain-containing protein [Marinobacterium nitratireducens]GGO86995.1 ABC transporter ATP-binding protein [Marinobacterium nitratireducens]
MDEDAVKSTGGNAYWSEPERLRQFEEVLGQTRLQRSPIARCLPALMVSLDWFGAPQLLASRLPPANEALDFDALRDLMTGIGFRCDRLGRHGGTGSNRHLPLATLALEKERCLLFLGEQDGRYWWFDGTELLPDWEPGNATRLYRFARDPAFVPPDAPQQKWLAGLVAQVRNEFTGIAAISLVSNILLLAISLFTMVVYNDIIPSGSTTTLWSLVLAAMIAILGSAVLRIGRTRVLSSMSGWAGDRIGATVMRKTLGLPLETSTRLGTVNNVTRMRTLENIRQFFGGGAGASLIDYPFVLVFLVVIALLGGWIVLVPIFGMILLFVAAKLLHSLIDTRSRRVGRLTNRLQEELVGITTNLRALQGMKGADNWLRRFADLSAQAAEANRDLSLANAYLQSVGHGLGMLTVLATMGIGVVLVLEGVMTTGGLIATMMLIWRVTTPAQQFFMASINLRQLIDATQQLDRLMNSIGERLQPHMVSPVDQLEPRIGADRLFYRYAGETDAALNGISFEAPAGARIAVIGPNGAGKTTLLQCLAGLRTAQNGHVTLAGRDIRQFDPSDYRAWISYFSDETPLLPVTLREFFLLRDPAADDDKISAAIERVAGSQWWTLFDADSVEAALEQRLDPWRLDQNGLGLRRLIGLSVALLNEPALLLLDNPSGGVSPKFDARLLPLLDELHGKTTVIIATHRPDIIKGADMALILDHGNLAHFGPVNQEEQATAPEVVLEGTPT